MWSINLWDNSNSNRLLYIHWLRYVILIFHSQIDWTGLMFVVCCCLMFVDGWSWKKKINHEYQTSKSLLLLWFGSSLKTNFFSKDYSVILQFSYHQLDMRSIGRFGWSHWIISKEKLSFHIFDLIWSVKTKQKKSRKKIAQIPMLFW